MMDLQQYLEYQCDRIEALLAARGTPVNIVGGAVNSRRVTVRLQPAPYTKAADIEAARGDLAALLGDCDVYQVGGFIVIAFDTPAAWATPAVNVFSSQYQLMEVMV